MKFFCTLIFYLLVFISPVIPQDASATVDINNIVMLNSPLLLGISFDSRTSLTRNSVPAGYYNTDGTIIPAIDSAFHDFPIPGLRYPANGIMQGFDWKKSIGSIADREAQILFGASSESQVVNFGFDEFMTMTQEKNVDPKNVQIMIPIYDNSFDTLTATQKQAAVLTPPRFNADWVEYCNSPNDYSNSNGGIDWAAVRDSNGHAEPYGIEIWNLGNEPYTPNEFDITGVNNYINTIVPIIDSMLLADPSIKISVTVTGRANSMWTNTILNSSLLQGKIYAVNAHYFSTEEIINGIIPYGVDTIESALTGLAAAAEQYNYKLIVGDYAHAILSHNNPDVAMQWQGANLCADFLLMMSQIPNIERADFWVYGLTSSVWHPIRLNTDGTYTSMPAAELYKIFNPLFLDNSISVETTSPPGSDGNSYSVRSGAFVSNDLSRLNVIAVNRDKNDSHSLEVNGIEGYNISTARLLTGASLTAEIIDEDTVSADNDGNFTLPVMSVLILQYQKITDPLPVELISFTAEIIKNNVFLKWSTATEINNYGFEIERSAAEKNNWQMISFIPGHGSSNNLINYEYADKELLIAENYSFRLKQIDLDGSFKYSNTIKAEIEAPLKFELAQNYPNPFNPITKIKFTVPPSPLLTKERGRGEVVTLIVYDILGNEISTLINEEKSPGDYEVEFKTGNYPSGAYFYKLSSGAFNQSKKMILLR